MREVISCNDAECKLVGEIIEFLHSNGMIQKIKVVKKFKNSVLSWIKKKFCNIIFKNIINDKINDIKLNIICKVLMKIGIYKIIVLVVIVI